MKIHNSMSKTKEEFEPLNAPEVKMYACGITVYDDCHIGHAKQAVTFDIIRRYLEYKGYKVTYVRNYTDVDDKIIARANQLGINALEYSQDRINEVERVMNLLGVRVPDIEPKASENIQNIIEFVSKLIEKGHAYPSERGDVYYSVKSFPGYGKLSKRNPDDMLNGVRKDVEEGKRDPLDFALWKSAKEGEISWDSPWGKGRPGWHIECSAMNLRYLGEQIDIHGGGKDLLFPHHENEIAQTEALTGKQFAKYWIHNGLITINGQKMSKSLGNSLTVKDALAKYNKEVIKYMLMQKHYASTVDINDQEFLLAEKHMYYFYNTFNEINRILANVPANGEVVNDEVFEKIEPDFVEAMDDDFNTASAYANLFAVMKYLNTIIADKKMDAQTKSNLLKQIKDKVIELYNILAIFEEEPEEFLNDLKNKYLGKLSITSDEIEKLIDERKEAKANKDYARADEIRNGLDEKGIVLLDGKDGTTWNIKELQ
ncbi:MAG: cysteine--tRNA ligase [Clostridia bacterium]|nr:cysteine--tRNA ligase [Clostridia bacterium]